MPPISFVRLVLSIITLLAPRDTIIKMPTLTSLFSRGHISAFSSPRILACADTGAKGVEYHWIGGRGYWSDASNWLPMGVPGINDTAVISVYKGQHSAMNAEYNTSV